MQSLNWNDLKYMLALARTGSYSAAGRQVGASDTTVARRIKALEHQLGVPLFASDGAELTALGQLIYDKAEAMERESIEIVEAVGQTSPQLQDSVRISAVPFLCHRILLPALATLHEMYPALTIELVPEARNLDLNKREADLALRFAQPVAGGLKVKAVKLGSLQFAAFAAAETDPKTSLPWVTYDDSSEDLPQARWMAAYGGDARAGIRVTDAETALEAVVQGLGQTLLPEKAGRADRRLRLVNLQDAPAMPTRDVWLLSHVDQNNRRAIKATKTWLLGIDW